MEHNFSTTWFIKLIYYKNSKDPRRFHGHDLISILQHHEPPADDEFALSILAACSSSTHVRKRQIRRLLDIASGEITNIGEKKVDRIF